MNTIQVERIGGLAGFGGPRSRVRSLGEVDLDALSAKERRAVESLFATCVGAESSRVRDGFCYRISRTTAEGIETIEAPEAIVPGSLTRCVRDELV